MIHYQDGVFTYQEDVKGLLMTHRFDYSKYLEINKRQKNIRDRYVISGKIYEIDNIDNGGVRVIKNHPLTGRKFIDKDNGRIYHIERISLRWYFGYYEFALIRQDDGSSHSTIVVKNISSLDATIIESASLFESSKLITD